MHHAYADGVTMARWTAQGLSESAATCSSSRSGPSSTAPTAHGATSATPSCCKSAWQQVAGTGQRVLGIGRLGAMLMLESVKLTKNAIALPFVSTARTPLTGQVSAGRQFTSTTVSMARVDAHPQAHALDAEPCGADLPGRRAAPLPSDLGVELKRPITIQMPVNLRREGDKTAGNKIGIIQVELSSPTDDPYVRLRNIGFSLRNVRTMIDSVAPEAIESYTIITGLVAQAAEMLKLSNSCRRWATRWCPTCPGRSRRCT